MTIALQVLAVALILAGIAGTVLPALPGPFLVLGGLLLFAWADGFVHVGGTAIVIATLLILMTAGVDVVAGAIGARRFGASPRAVGGAILGTLAGLFFGLPGLLLGPFVGAVIGELTARRDVVHAGRAGVGAWIGLMVGMAAKLGLEFAAIGVVAWAYFF